MEAATIINIIESFIVIGGATWGLCYYKGWLNYSDEKELRRKEKVRKYESFLILGLIMSYIGGLLLLGATLLG